MSVVNKSILAQIEEARKELLDLSLRNPLLNYRPLRARGLEVVGESAVQVFGTLVSEGKPMSFLARPSSITSDKRDDEEGLGIGQPEDAAPSPVTTNQSDRRLQTAETSEGLQRRLLTTHRLANSTIEETGVNTLFIALGMLCWYESDQSGEERRSPLILVPVRLDRDGVRENFRVAFTGEDIGANLSFIEKARSDFGLHLPEQDVVELVADGTVGGTRAFFDRVEEDVRRSGLHRWRVERDRVALGFFSYNKLQMFRDLDNDAWPPGAGIAENEIIGALFGDGFSEPAPVIPRDGHIDSHLSPHDTYHVLDADSSQSLAIHEAASGGNLVIQGPPGTGKSQTIANIIADAVGRGKLVLFVAEKMAALEVVKRRLDNIGLGQACLELHSHKTNKREILVDLARTLNAADPAGGDSNPDLDELARARSELNDYVAALNTPVGQSGITPCDAFGELLAPDGNDTPNPIDWTKITDIGEWSGADFRRKREIVEDLRLRLQRCGIPRQHPFWGCRLRVLLPAAHAALREKLEDAAASLGALHESSSALADGLGMERPADMPATSVLVAVAQHTMDAPDTRGLDLSATQWETHPAQIQEMMDLGLRWQRLRRERLADAARGLAALADASDALADGLGMDRVQDAAAVGDLLSGAALAVAAPDTSGLDLSAIQWETHAASIRDLVNLGLHWQRTRRQMINAASRSLETLAGPSGTLADVLCLDRPADVAAADNLLTAAGLAVIAPAPEGLNLAAPQWQSHAAEISELVDLGLRWRKIRREYDAVMLPQAWDADLQEARQALDADGRRFWRRLFSSGYKRARRQLATISRGNLPQCVDQQIALIDGIITEQWLRAEINGQDDFAGPALGRRWAGHDTDWEAVAPAVRWWQDVLTGVAGGWVLPGAVPLLQSLQVWPEAGALRNRVDDLDRDLNDYRRCAVELQLVLDADNRTLPTSPDGLPALPFAEQLLFLNRLPDLQAKEIGEVPTFGNETDGGWIGRMIPQAMVAEINGQYTASVPVLGCCWAGHYTDWETIAPAVRWWLDILACVARGSVPPGALSVLRAIRVWPKADGTQAWILPDGIDGLNRALNAYRDCAAELQKVLDADNRNLFSTPGGLVGLPFAGQRRMLGDWSGRPFTQTETNLRFNNSPCPEWVERLRPDEIVARINGRHSDAALVLGQRWKGQGTEWDAIDPAVRWWQDVLAGAREGRVLPGVTCFLREMQQRAGTVQRPDRNLKSGIVDLGQDLGGHSANVHALQSALEMDNQLRFDSPGGLAALPFTGQRDILSGWTASLPEIQGIIGFNAGGDAALAQRLRPVAVAAQDIPGAAESLTEWFERAWYESIAETALGQRTALLEFDGRVHEGRIERFRAIDRQSLAHNRGRVSAAHRSGPSRVNELPGRLPRLRGDEGVDSETALTRRRLEQLRFLQREIQKRTRQRPIRQLLMEAGGVIQELKPVFMMSPLSIANYLTPGSVNFDLVVFDEASQVRPVDALGALMRAQKAVVVGDSMQLPPTSFFDRVAQSSEDSVDEDESVTSDIESVLGLFSARGAPSSQLRWHYRSRHESLIAVSNREFYDNRLVVFPSPDAGREASGLRFHHLSDTSFDRGRSATNQQEAEAVAHAVMQHAARTPELSLGVAAFSIGQSRAIQDRLELLRLKDDSGEDFFASHPEEPFFVKNLENVQGDERDVIFISVGYGRDAAGRVAMNFGPINRNGGERRLNVLITRAKQQCHVFTNLRADDIDLERSKASGVRALKTFLAYAETGVMPGDVPYEGDFAVESPFQRAVARRLEERGYEVHQEVAAAAQFIDIRIVDPQSPGRYVIGIECDGASYYSSRSARDRDRLREEVLRGLGWELHRIWSTDWFRNPERELERAVEAIERANQRS